MSQDRNTVLLAILAGAAIGAGIGILLAPDKGSVTRKRLMQAADGTAYNLKNNLAARTELLRRKLNNSYKDIESTYDDFQPDMRYTTEESILFL